MPLTPYHSRLATPPAAEVPCLVEGGHSRNYSGSSSWSSPDSIENYTPTPLDRSPIHRHGPTLLPRIRTQDQSLEPIEHFQAQPKSHRRALSQQFNPPAAPPAQRPRPERSVTVPPECNPILSPTSAVSTTFSFGGDLFSVNSPITVTPSVARRGVGHSRASSASSINDTTINRYGYPTYRRQPSYLANACWNDSVVPGSADFVPPPTTRAYTPEYQQLSSELLALDDETITSNDYLRGPNPAIDLLRQVNMMTGKGMHTHFWWDIRNLRPWSAFTLPTIQAIPSFPELLDIAIPRSVYPSPTIPAARLRPETQANLVELVRDFYAAKINAALAVTQGQRHMVMRPSTERNGPAFVSAYQDDGAQALLSGGRGRVVGVVRSYERWNSGLRHGNGNDKVRYLEGLALLHRHMREHGTRYGFIMTETELVCARNGSAETPYFGHLELAQPIETRSCKGSKSGRGEGAGGEGAMTACLALWFLHMLAKEEPLPGQVGWRTNIGAPAAMTRTHVLEEKDAWIPQPQVGEKRDAKTMRGWVWPKDPWNKKREGRVAGRF